LSLAAARRRVRHCAGPCDNEATVAQDPVGGKFKTSLNLRKDIFFLERGGERERESERERAQEKEREREREREKERERERARERERERERAREREKVRERESARESWTGRLAPNIVSHYGLQNNSKKLFFGAMPAV